MGNFWQDSPLPVEEKMEALLSRYDTVAGLAAVLDNEIKTGKETVENIREVVSVQDEEILILISEIAPDTQVGQIAKRVLEQKY